ncbi:hypothetical protein L915_06970 [Phytophthora nicotianae]|uniref:Uncharacterized protein n=1 Tax=Phytophthora nicotianae TaxID=4792 RepID=W2H0T0_PHYNI|nr:hypothetical protein L915_06970 [Phytophthora nicotianae]
MDELDAHVEEVLENTTAEKTKYTYLRAIARFVEWLHTNTDDDRRHNYFVAVKTTFAKSRVFGLFIYAKLYALSYIYGAAWSNRKVYIWQRALSNCVLVHSNRTFAAP